MRKTAFLPLLLLIAGCQFADEPARTEAPADSVAGEVAFELAGPGGAALVVPVHVNGQGPYSFVLDTGATLTCIKQELADSLGLPEESGRIGLGAGVGGSGRLRLVRVDTIRVGQARAFDMTACALDLESLGQVQLDVSGLLGLNFIKEYRVLLDFERNVVRFEGASG